jgi:hypothetical protein
MARAYSWDLRERVVGAVAAGQSCPINVYFVEAEDINPGSGIAGDGKRFEFGPDKLLYGLRWLHKGEPPDLDLALAPPFVRAPEVWFPYVTTMLLGALQEVDPGLRRRLAASP